MKDQANINLKQYPNVKCGNCDGEVFDRGHILKAVPGLALGVNQPLCFFAIEVNVCKKCGAVHEQSAPEKLQSYDTRLPSTVS